MEICKISSFSPQDCEQKLGEKPGIDRTDNSIDLTRIVNKFSFKGENSIVQVQFVMQRYFVSNVDLQNFDIKLIEIDGGGR